ncbi:MAG: hypothetical protein C4292_06105 [Nitrososphaera sp.]
MTQVDRDSRCVVGWTVVEERAEPDFQAMRDRRPQALQYFSDAFAVYGQLIDEPGRHQACADKSQTYAVKADNAEIG